MKALQPRLGDRKAQRGSALVLTLVILTGMLMLGSLHYRLATRSAREATAVVDERRAFHLAEAALSEAMMALRAESPGLGNVGSAANPAYLGGGVLWVTSTALPEPNTYQIVATAMAGSGRAAIEAVVEIKKEDPLFYAVLNSDETLTLNANVVIDSFDSKLGTYASQAVNTWGAKTYANDEGDVTSNMNVVLNSDATVFGDAMPGPGYGVSFASGSHVSGSTTASSQPFSFPPIVVPTVASAGPYTVATGATKTLPPGTYGFDDFTLGKAANLTVTGPANIVVNNFVGGKDARLNIDATAGPVTFYVQGNYSHMSNFESLPVSGSPMAVAFMVQGTSDVVFPSGAKVKGAYYVPNANVLFAASNEAWGAFAANRVDMSSSMKFHYDESLDDYWNDNDGGNKDPLHLLVWRRGVVAPAQLMQDRSDPFQVLGVAKAGLLSPANSW